MESNSESDCSTSKIEDGIENNSNEYSASRFSVTTSDISSSASKTSIFVGESESDSNESDSNVSNRGETDRSNSTRNESQSKKNGSDTDSDDEIMIRRNRIGAGRNNMVSTNGKFPLARECICMNWFQL